MNFKQLIWLAVLMAGVIVLKPQVPVVHAMHGNLPREERETIKNQLATQVPTQTVIPTLPEMVPIEERDLPEVGNNALLVLGASILVLIIIGGVLLSSRLKSKH